MSKGDYLSKTKGGTQSKKDDKSTRKGGKGGGTPIDLGAIFDIFGGLFGGSKQKKIAEEEYREKIRREKIAYERSLPWNSESALGSVTFDPETKMMLQSLSPEMQALMGNFLGQSTAASDELARLTADPYAMEQEQFQRFEDMNANAYNQSRLQVKEAANAQGREGTQGYYDELAVEDSINQNRMAGQMASIGTGMDYRNMLGQESLNFGQGGMNVAGMLNSQADLGRLIGQGSNFGGGSNAVSLAGNNYADTRSNYISGMMGQGRKYNSKGEIIQDEEDNIFNKFSSIFT